jgi:hypothetical protein
MAIVKAWEKADGGNVCLDIVHEIVSEDRRLVFLRDTVKRVAEMFPLVNNMADYLDIALNRGPAKKSGWLLDHYPPEKRLEALVKSLDYRNQQKAKETKR